MTVYEVVNKLIGPIDPIGESTSDDVRFENLKVMVNLIEGLLVDLEDINSRNARSHEFSRKRAANYIEEFFNRYKDESTLL